jgi:hypothetical protein
MLVLKHCPTPERILALGGAGILKLWKTEMAKPSMKKAERLVWVSQESVGRRDGTTAAVAALGHLMAGYELECRHKEETETQMQKLLIQVPNASKLVRIKGVSMTFEISSHSTD